MDDHQLRFPGAIDDPMQLMLWSADELIPMFVCISIGMLFDHFFLMLVIGVGLWRTFRRYKNSRPDGYLLHAVYWAGAVFSRSRVLANPYARHWFG